MQSAHIPISAIHDVLRAVEESPDCDETEVSKVEAMRRLVLAIKTMQAKGYRLTHIAKLLSDEGIAVTETTLKQYMHRIGSRMAAESSRVGKRHRVATGSPAKQLSHGSRPSDPAVAMPARNQQPHSDEAVTSPARIGSGTASITPPLARRVPTPPVTQVAASRPGFVVRPDTKNI
jgi:hypothetical protein